MRRPRERQPDHAAARAFLVVLRVGRQAAKWGGSGGRSGPPSSPTTTLWPRSSRGRDLQPSLHETRSDSESPSSLSVNLKTLKYRPDFPDQFGSIEDARDFCDVFYRWYNHDHRHSGIGMHTPFDVHHGHAEAVRQARATTLTAAYAATPERFVHKPPEPPALPGTTWINRPAPPTTTDSTIKPRN